jgi:pathogenesis-related protein 1
MSVLLLLILFAHGEGRAASPTALARDMLAVHNAVRARVGMAPLRWSDRLAAHAQEWANILLARREFGHRPHSTYGQNLFEIEGANASSAEVVNAWASESRNYDHRSNRCRGVCGHYTQIVWGDTKEVGCGVARGGGREVWVCDYDPPGNWAGQRPY